MQRDAFVGLADVRVSVQFRTWGRTEMNLFDDLMGVFLGVYFWY